MILARVTSLYVQNYAHTEIQKKSSQREYKKEYPYIIIFLLES